MGSGSLLSVEMCEGGIGTLLSVEQKWQGGIGAGFDEHFLNICFCDWPTAR